MSPLAYSQGYTSVHAFAHACADLCAAYGMRSARLCAHAAVQASARSLRANGCASVPSVVPSCKPARAGRRCKPCLACVPLYLFHAYAIMCGPVRHCALFLA
eukprot:6204157-Pleurochrysis_carterae.AAC.2